ncbi:MAG: HEPN domain-containing protein [Sphingobium sp.]
MEVVDNIYIDFQDAVSVLRDANQISLQIMLEANLRKTLLLSAASYFEVRLQREVQSFTDEVTSGNDLIRTLVQQKAVTRQYHSWFDWEKSNANKFFGMFGATFKEHMAVRIAEDQELATSVKAFLTIGNERNSLVHSDYASVYIDRTPDEIYALYLSAKRFVEVVGQELRVCSTNNAAKPLDEM